MPTGGPERTCIGCRTRRPQHDLIRLHLDGGGRLRVDRNGPGRGAWLCAADPVACLDRAVERRAIERALRRRPTPGSIDEVRDLLRAVGGRSVSLDTRRPGS